MLQKVVDVGTEGGVKTDGAVVAIKCQPGPTSKSMSRPSCQTDGPSWASRKSPSSAFKRDAKTAVNFGMGAQKKQEISPKTRGLNSPVSGRLSVLGRLQFRSRDGSRSHLLAPQASGVVGYLTGLVPGAPSGHADAQFVTLLNSPVSGRFVVLCLVGVRERMRLLDCALVTSFSFRAFLRPPDARSLFCAVWSAKLPIVRCWLFLG